MAIATDKIVLYFELRAGRKIDQELTKVKEKIKRWNHSLVSEMRNIFKRATLFRFSTVAINSFFNSLSYARGEAIKFQSALANIVKLDIDRYSTLASDATRQLGHEIGNLAAQYNVTRVDAAKAYQTVVTAGFRGAEATKLFETALLAQASAGLSADNAISLLIATMKQFGVGVNDTEKALDILLRIQSNAAIGFGEFAGAFRTGGAALASVTDNLAQAGALIAALSERTRESGSVVGTFFKTLSARTLGRATTKKQLAQLGIAVEVEGRLRPMIDLLEDLNKALENMGDARKGEILSVVAGQRQINRLVNIMGAIRRVRELEILGLSHVAEARRRASIEEQTFAAQWNKLQIQFSQGMEELMIGSMDQFIVVARGAATAITKITSHLKDWVVWVDAGAIRKAENLGEVDIKKKTIDILRGKYEALPIDLKKAIDQKIKNIDQSIIDALLGYEKRPTDKGMDEIEARFAELAKKEPKYTPSESIFDDPFLRAQLNPPTEVPNVMDKDIREMKNSVQVLNSLFGFIKEAAASGKQDSEKAMANATKVMTAYDIAFKDIEKVLEMRVKEGKELPETLKRFREGTGLPSPGAGEGGGAVQQTLMEEFKGAAPERARIINEMAKVNAQLSQTYEQILEPAKSFNDALLSQRDKLQAMLAIEGQLDEAGMKRINEQMAIYNKLQDETERKNVLIIASFEKQKIEQEVLLRQRQREAKLLEFDANALRRLNTRLAGLKDGARDASAKIASASKSLNEARKSEIRSIEQVASATASMKLAIGQYQVGLMMARVEAGKITGAIGGLAQELASVENIGKVIDGEMRLDTLRRDSLSYQLDLVQSIIQKQQQIGMSYLTGGIEQRTDIFRGFGALQNMFGKFGGDVGSFNQLSDTDMNDFGRMILSLPADVRKAMVDALGFLPEGGTIAGFTSEQLRSMLSSAALGRGGTVSNVQDLQKRAAEATVELARLNTDGLSVAMQQYQTANKQLDQATAQTELQKIRVAQAREQMNITLQTSQEQRDHIERQMAGFSEMAAALRESQMDQTPLYKRIQEMADTNKNLIETQISKQREKKDYQPIIDISKPGIMGPYKPSIMGPPAPIDEMGPMPSLQQRGESAVKAAKELGDRFDAVIKKLDDMEQASLRKIEEIDQKRADRADVFAEKILGTQLLEGVGAKETKVLIEVANQLQIEYTNVAELPFLIADTVRNLPQIKDFDSFKGALRTIISAIATSINTGQTLDPGVLSLISGTAVQ